MTRNLTPDLNGLPEGLTEAEFIKVMRTGEDIHCEKAPLDPICARWGRRRRSSKSCHGRPITA